MRTPSPSVVTSQRLLVTGLLVLLPALASHAEHSFSGKSGYNSGAYQDGRQRGYTGQYGGHRQVLDGSRLNKNRRFNDSQRRFDSDRHTSKRFGLRSGSRSSYSLRGRDRRSNLGGSNFRDRGNRSHYDRYPNNRSYDNGARYRPRFGQRSSQRHRLSVPKPFRRDRNPYGNRR
jgi:hypothetical protein